MNGSISRILRQSFLLKETAEKEVQETSWRGSGGVPQIQNSIQDWRIKGINLSFSALSKKERYEEIKLKFGAPQEGDMLLTSVGTLGIPYLVRKEDEFYFKDGNLTWFRNIDSKAVDRRFLYFWITSVLGQQKLYEASIGSTQPALTIIGLKNIDILLPSIPEQRAIAGVLSSLDDKINLLHRQNKTLDGIAKALWQKMFVEEADPNWKKARLGDYGQIICGKTPSKKVAEYFGGHIPFIKIPDMHGNVFIFETEDSLTETGVKSQQSKTIPAKSICVSCIATVGLVCMNAVDSQTNQQINTIIPNNEFQRYFLFLLMRNMIDDLLARASGGTATDNLNTGDFSRIEISKPPENGIQKFDDLVRAHFEKIYANQIQISTLSHLRDTLLPKLMADEVRVRI